jgi:hypothetical protein
MTRYRKLALGDIIVKDRVREYFNQEDLQSLADSISRHGLINPILVTANNILVAGERRYRAFQLLGLDEIPVMMTEELTEEIRRELELEENIRRSDLTWQEECMAVVQYHQLRLETDEDWTVLKTGTALGLNESNTWRKINTGRALLADDPLVVSASTYSSAMHALERRVRREIDSELSDMLRATTSDKEPKGKAATASPITCGDFIQLAKLYKGPPFNLVHCDFPYGIMHHKSDQGGHDSWETYEDTPEIYKKLVDILLHHKDKLIAPSAHLIFWFSMKYYHYTTAVFREHNFRVEEFPLIWHKSDGRGIVPDANRGPRRTYETALLITRGDRRIIKPVANSYACPTAKSEATHISQKPEPMLRHFMTMLVDDLSEVLDPTCGSGTALCAAESFGAKRIVGWELDPRFVETANNNVYRARTLRKL